MHCGYFVTLTGDRTRLVTSIEYQMLEEALQSAGQPDARDCVGPLETAEDAIRVRDILVSEILVYLHGSNNPSVVGAARNTSLFGLHGPAMGYVGAKLNIPLIQFYANMVTWRQYQEELIRA